MSSTPERLLQAEEEQSLHEQLCAEDPLAPHGLFRTYFLRLVFWLRQHHRPLDDSLVEAAAEQAIVSLIENPRAYDPGQRGLFGYLRMAAEADLKNLLAREARHHHGRKSWQVVEKAEGDGNCFGREEDPLRLLEEAEEQQAVDDLFRSHSSGWTEQEQQMLELMRRGEAQTEALAPLLGMEDQPFVEQQEAANRIKERLMKRLKREVKRHE